MTVDISIAVRDADAVCIEIAEARSVTVELDQPLAERALQIGDVIINA